MVQSGANGDAAAAVGVDDPNSDWLLRPDTHAQALPPQAGALARVLQRDDVRKIMARYDTSDSRAIAAQATYKSLSRRVIWARLLAIIAGGVIVLPLASSGLMDKGALSPILQVGTVLQYGLLAFALFVAAYMSARRFFARWMEARAEAEIARLGLFNYVIAADEPAQPSEMPLLTLALEYFRRYQLDVQKRYYRGRGGEHLKAAGETKLWRFLLRFGAFLALAPLGLTVAAYLGLSRGPAFRRQGALAASPVSCRRHGPLGDPRCDRGDFVDEPR